MSVTIVPIAESHAASFREGLDAVAREKKYLALTEAPAPERVEAFIRESVANDSAQFVALADGRVVGWADIFPGWAHAISHVGRLGMGVLPDFRGQGIGKRLLESCISKAWSKGITRIELEVRADNARAIKLYERFGFAREGVKRRAMRFDGVYYDSIQMSLIRDDV